MEGDLHIKLHDIAESIRSNRYEDMNACLGAQVTVARKIFGIRVWIAMKGNAGLET